MKKVILILNGSHSEIPLIKAAKRMGLRVITTGNDPTQIGHKYSDQFIKADFNKKKLILKIAQKNKINFICPPAHDLGIVTASYVAEKLKLPGFDTFKTTQTVHLKNKFKNFCKKINLKTPTTFNQNHSYEHIKKTFNVSKMIVKPTDMGGGKGISIAENTNTYRKAIALAKKISKSQNIVIEDYVEGQLHSLTTYIKNQKIIFYHHDNELTYKNPFNVHSSFAPSTLSKKYLKYFIVELEKFSRKLRLVDGILHAQIIANETNAFIIELTRRCSGDLYPLPVEHMTNIPWSNIIINTFTGKKVFIYHSNNSKKLCARHCLTALKNGTAKKIFIDPNIRENIISKIIFLKNSQIITNFANQKYGVFILKFSSSNEMKEKMSKINKLIYIET